MSESITPSQLDLVPIARAAIVGAILFSAAAVVWQLPAAREILDRPVMRNLGLDLVASLLRADGIATPGLA